MPLATGMSPAIRLRIELERHRRAGLEWDDQVYWSLALRSLHGTAPDERAGWLLTFNGHRALWEAGYRRTLQCAHPLELDLL